jgi:hypothetical protein
VFDRRGLLSGIAEQTPVTLDVVADDLEHSEEFESEENVLGVSQGNDTDHLGSTQAGSQPQQSPIGENKPSQKKVRQPAWSTELENRRRLVEPALRTSNVVLGGLRKSTGTLMFLLDAASADSRFVALKPCRMPIDKSGNPNGQPKPIIIGPQSISFGHFDADERRVLANLAGTTSGETHHGGQTLEERTMSRFLLSRQSASQDLAMLCAEGRLVFQPEPRRSPETVVPLVWDAGRPWEFALMVEPGDDTGLEACLENDLISKSEKRICPKKASLHGLLVRGSERQSLQTPRLILRAGFIVLGDCLCRLVIDAAAEEHQTEYSENDEPAAIRGWMEQFDRRGPIELSGSQIDGLIEQLASLADLPKLELPGWTGWQVESGKPQPKLVLDDSPNVKEDQQDEFIDPEASLGRPKRKSRKSKPKVQLGGKIWFDYGGIQIAADDPAGGAADAARRRLVRRNRIAERTALTALPRFGFSPVRTGQAGVLEENDIPTHHVEVPRSRLDASVSQLASVGWECHFLQEHLPVRYGLEKIQIVEVR